MKNIQPTRVKQSFSKYLLNTLIPILINGIVIGILVGTLIWAYTFCAEYIMEFSHSIYSQVNDNIYFLPLLMIGVTILAIFMALILKFIPELAGSGIPYTEGVMRGQLRFKKLKMLIGTICLSFVSFLAGLPLGAEGPSVQLGGLVGDIVNTAESKAFKRRPSAWRRLSITGGASAALASAFNAPLTGIIFALEEGHKRFAPTILLSAAMTVITATLFTRLLNLWTGLKHTLNYFLFDMGEMDMLPLKYLYMLLILGIILGLLATCFSSLMMSVKHIIERYEIPRVYRLISSYILVAVIGVFLLDMLGGGSSLIKKIGTLSLTWQTLLLLLLMKFLLVSLVSNSGSTGGLFIPMLAIGALAGGLVGYLFLEMGMPEEYYKVIVVVSMSAFMSAVVRAPLTGIVLVAEITGQLLSGFLQTALVVVIAYFIVELFNIKPMYEELLETTLRNLHKDKEMEKAEIEVVIEDGSFAVGRSVRDILWPAGCHIEKILKLNKKGEVVTRNDNDGERLIHAGDVYYFYSISYSLVNTIEELRSLTSDNNDEDDNIRIIKDDDTRTED